MTRPRELLIVRVLIEIPINLSGLLLEFRLIYSDSN
jgi:hypothetical protein